MSVYQKYCQIKENISHAAKQSGRDPDEITLIAVSKGYSWEAVQPAYEAGCRDFGESRIQEAMTKMDQAPNDIRWHFIGTLQKNKVRKVIESFSLIHSVDSVELAQKIAACSQELGIVTRVLLEVNTSGESSKHGLSPDDWKTDFLKINQLEDVSIEGLMTMAPYVEDVAIIKQCFGRLDELRKELQKMKGGSSLRHLSMGMSHDYLLAIETGATLLRVGTALFEGC